VREKTLLLVKPDGVARNLVDDIKARVKTAGLMIVESKKIQVSESVAKELYSVHAGKPFYPGLIKFITSGPIVANIVEGEGAILRLRELMGATDPRKAEPGTIRGDLREENIFTEDKIIKNLVHGSDSTESANREIPIFFPEGVKI